MWANLDRFLQYVSAERRYSRNTVEAYRRDLSQFLDYLENKSSQVRLDLVEPYMIRSYIEELFVSGLEKSSISRKLSAIKSFFRFYNRIGEVTINPANGISAPKLDKKLPTVLSENEMLDAIASIKGSSFESIRNRAILEMFYGCGIRLDELISLQMKQISLSGNNIRVMGKRNKERTIPMGDKLKEALLQYLKVREQLENISKSGFVFVNADGFQLKREYIQSTIKKYLSRVSEQDHLSPHVIRHTFATHLLDRGADLLAVKELLGHTSLSTTQIYTHVSMDRLKSIYGKSHPRSKREVN